MKKYPIVISLILFIFLSLSVSALTKAEIIAAALKCCKSQLNVNRKDGIGLMLLSYLTTETSSNRDVLLIQAKMGRGFDIKADKKGDLDALNKLFIQASVAYIKAKQYNKAAYYLKMAEKLSPLSDEALINQHLLQTKGFKITNEQLLGAYGSGGVIKPIKPIPSNTKKPTGKLPANTETFKIDGHHYALIFEKANWQEARKKAETLGGYLVCITSKNENEAVLKYTKKHQIWIGGSDEIKEGSFKWMSGEQFSYSHFSDGEPNNSGRNGEDYLVFLKGEWNDKPGENQNGYIIEWDK